MIQRVLSHYRLTGLTCVGLVLFMLVFVSALFWIFRRGSSALYGELEDLPLRDLATNSERKL